MQVITAHTSAKQGAHNMNRFKTSDIILHKNSCGEYDARHRFQGQLYETLYFETRTEARRAAVDELKYAKEFGQTRYASY